MENINWYPGHMKKTRELIKENLKLVDAAVEIRDARIPRSSENPIIDQLTQSKPRIVVLNKADLADKKETQQWIKHMEQQGISAIAMNSMRGEGVKNLVTTLQKLKEKRTGNRATKPFHIMVVGIPNVGKSSLINRLTGHKSAKTGDRPGVTKGKQWLTMKNGMQLLDTPGILWPKFEDPKVGLDLAFCGSIKDETMDVVELGLALVKLLQKEYPQLLAARYKLEQLPEDGVECLTAIAKKRGFIMSGGRIDYGRATKTILDEFRESKIGNITLEKVDESR